MKSLVQNSNTLTNTVSSIYQLQQLSESSQTIKSSLNLVQHDLNLLLTSLKTSKELAPSLDDFINPILVELQQIREKISEAQSVSNEIHLVCVDAKQGDKS